MRQDLQLTFVDILGYLLPGTILSWIIVTVYNPLPEKNFEYYLIILGMGYLIGHILLMLHQGFIGKLGRFLFGDLAMNVPPVDEVALKNKRERRRRKRHRFMRKRLKLPIIPKSLSEKMWNSANLKWNKSRTKIDPDKVDVVGELKYLYWWEITQWELIYKQERRLRALVILFGNSCYALFGLAVFLVLQLDFQLATLSLFGSILCFFVYCRYRYYRLRHINIQGYFLRQNRIMSNN